MDGTSPLNLGKRERQIVETLYRLGEASVADVRAALDDPPSYSAVRAMLNVLLDKGVLKVRRDGKRFLYRPAAPKEKVRQAALRNLVRTFFGGRSLDAVAALLDESAIPAKDIERMKQLIEEAERKEQ